MKDEWGFDGWGPEMTLIDCGVAHMVSKDLPCFCPRMKKNNFLIKPPALYLPRTQIVVSLFSLQCMIQVMGAGRRKGAE